MKLKSVVLITLYLTSISLMASNNSEDVKKQNSDSFRYDKSGDVFKIIRESNNGTDCITFHYSNAGNNYYVTNQIGLLITLTNKDLQLKSTNTDILGLNSFSFTGDYNQFITHNNTLIYNYSDQVIEDVITLISFDPSKKSYQFKLKIKPSIIIDNNPEQIDYEFITTLKENPDIRSYLKKQLLGSNRFTSEDQDFPIANIDNGYIINVEPVFNNDSIDIQKYVKFEKLKYFDLIYDYGINVDNKYGRSIIKKLLNIYYEKDKPLFHHYMDKSSINDFDYTLYDKLTKVEGKEFVNRALTYLTWGVEYSLHGINSGDISYNIINNSYPSQLIKTSGLLDSWCSSISNSQNSKTNNYLESNGVFIDKVVNEYDITYLNKDVDELNSVVPQLLNSGLSLTTPFFYTDINRERVQKIVGSSLPYVKDGIDSPRTFNYKMLQQYEIIKNKQGGYYNYKGATNNYLYSLNDESIDVNSEDYYYYKSVNPNEVNAFYPGYDFNNNDGFIGANLTGVDIFGLISGALSMTNFSEDLITINNNSEKLALLDSYYKMDEAGFTPSTDNAVLDENGRPFFSDNPLEDISIMKFTREDIERVTVIVPDLKKIQPGDLLVGTIEGNNEIAIVVDPGNYEESSVFDMSEVLVLTVTENDRRVTLNYWSEGANKLKAFTLNPKDFIPRRIIKFNKELVSTFNQEDESWDPMIYTPEPMVTILDTDVSDPKNYGNWIPNTGEFFNINSIMFQHTSDNKNIIEDDIDVIIEAPTDLNYDDSTSDDNIFVNKGDGFELYAHYRNSNGKNIINDYLKLATFNLNRFSSNGESRYTVDYNHEIFDEIGNTKSNYKLKYYSDSGMSFKIITEHSELSTNQFAIRPLKNNIRSGDDISLNFSITVDGITSTTSTSDYKNILSVYDKKMLWRANLYIDSKDESDWNIKYPWNAPATGTIKGSFQETYKGRSVTTRVVKLNNKQLETDSNEHIWFGNNSWNREYNGVNPLDSLNFEPDEDDYLKDSGLLDGNGRQTVKILPFTYHPKITGSNNQKKEKDVVSYAYGCSDSPFEFNDELRQQKEVLSLYYNHIGIKFKKPKTQWGDLIDETNVNMFSAEQYNLLIEDYDILKGDDFKKDGQHISLNGWKGTTSPEPWLDNRGDIYIKPSVYLGTSEIEYSVPREVNEMSGEDNFPYLPGYSLFYYLENDSCPDWLNVISAGVDCNGFVARSSSYSDNPYIWDDAGNQNINEGHRWFTNPSYPYWQQVGDHEISSYRVTDKNNRDDFDVLILDKIKPGDLIYTQDSSGYGKHIAIVLDINYSDNMTLSDIKLIESTWGNDKTWAKIMASRTLNDYGIKDWVAVRLK